MSDLTTLQDYELRAMIANRGLPLDERADAARVLEARRRTRNLPPAYAQLARLRFDEDAERRRRGRS